jgi:hypothetical protein
VLVEVRCPCDQFSSYVSQTTRSPPQPSHIADDPRSIGTLTQRNRLGTPK